MHSTYGSASSLIMVSRGMRQGRLLGRPSLSRVSAQLSSCSSSTLLICPHARLPPSLSRPTGYGPLTRSANGRVYGHPCMACGKNLASWCYCCCCCYCCCYEVGKTRGHEDRATSNYSITRVQIRIVDSNDG